MTILQSAIVPGGTTGYNLQRSLRFRSSASAYLNRTPASAGNRQIWTWSAWVKRGKLTDSAIQTLLGTASNTDLIGFDTDDTFRVWFGTNTYSTKTTQVFRDPSSWYHFVVAVDTTQATASNRLKIYVNGSQITALSASYPTQNYNTGVDNTVEHRIGKMPSGDYNYFDGYLAEVNFIDGQALTPSSFGSTNALTGVWQPAAYSGSYGTNGFYLPFTDNSALTSGSNAGLGKDFSGNGNYWNTNNISITSGSTYDSMTDVPTLTSATVANYEVLSPIDTYDNPPTQGNLTRTSVGHGGSPWSTCRGTLGVSSGKWYFEATLTGSIGSVGNNMVGVMTTTTSTLSDAYGGSTTRSYQANGVLQGDNQTGSVSSAVSGDVIMIAFDVDAGKLWVGKNGTWMNSGVPASGTGNVFTTLPTSPIVPQVSMYGNTGDNYGWYMNFGQRPFTYTPPSGFVALNTYNLPTPTIQSGAAYMNPVLYTGNGSTQSITGLGFKPDFVWVKNRSNAIGSALYDSVRGATKNIPSDSSSGENTDATGLTAFNSGGFSVGSFSKVNNSGNTYVGWNWFTNGGSSSSNTSGSITSTVSANTTAGFSVVTYTGTGANATVGHGLGVAPSMVMVKRTSSTASWGVYHISTGNTTYMALDVSNAAATSATYWNNTSPTSSVFSVGTALSVNGSGSTYVAYCFAPVTGYSAFGSYTGNGSADGPFVFTGFRPRFVLTKRTDSATGGNWQMHDTTRATYNVVGPYLRADSTAAEVSAAVIDILSNGFKMRTTDNGWNASGGTYLYMAFAENPFKVALAR